MISVIIILAFLLLLFIVRSSSKITKSEKKLLTVYLAAWWYSVFFSRLQFFNLNPVADKTCYLLILHVFTFIFGYLLCISKRKVQLIDEASNNLNDTLQKLLGNRAFNIILILCTLYVISKFVLFFNMVVAANAINVRSDYFEGNLYGNEFGTVNGFILFPLNCICMLLWSYSLCHQRNWQFWVMTVFVLLSNSLAGGRFGYVWLCLCLLFYVLFSNYNIEKYAPRLCVIAVGTYFLMAYVTAARFGGDVEISWSNIQKNGIELTNEQMFTYTAAPPVALDYSLNNDFVGQIGGHKYGGLVFAPVLQVAYIVLNKLGRPFHQPIFDYAERIQDVFIDNGNSGWNALYTSVNVYYLDAGVFGVIFYPFLFGLIFCWCFNLYNRTRSVWHLILLCYVFRIVVTSIMNFFFFSANELFAVVLFYILGMRQTKKQVERI